MQCAFYIFDLCGIFAFFRLDAKGREAGSIATLQGGLFNTKVDIIHKQQELTCQTEALNEYRIMLERDLLARIGVRGLRGNIREGGVTTLRHI